MDIGPRFFLRTRLMLQMLRGEQGRLLDVGCGDGFFLAELARRGFAAVGLDTSAQAVALCQKRVAPLGAQAYCLPLDQLQPESPFDIVVCGEVLEHVADDVGFLREVRRVLHPAGTLVLSVPLDMRLWNEADVNAGHFRRYTKHDILGKLAATGFAVERTIVWGWPLTRALHFWIRRQQSVRMIQQDADSRRRDPVRRLKPLLQWARCLFLVDNLFNWTERGVGIVIRAHAIPQMAGAADD